MSSGCAARLSGACDARASAAATGSAPGQDLPPLLLDDEEAIATAVSLLAAGGAVAGAGDAALRALTKLDQVLPTRLRHEVRALSGSVESFGGGRTPVDPEVLMTLARACRDEVEAGFGYSAPGATCDGGGSSPTAWSPPTGAGTSSPTTSIATTGAASASTG